MAKPSAEDFKRECPSLVEEMGGQGTISLDSVRGSADEAERAATPTHHGDEPTAVDYIRRCSTEDQAVEIINYLEAKGEVEAEHAKQLRAQLAEKGLGSFGKRRKPGCYERGEID